MRTEICTDEDGGKTIYIYDQQDRHIRTTDYDANGQMTCDIIYEYGDDGNVSGWRVYRTGGQLFKRFEQSYNEQGLIEVRQYDAEGRLELRNVETYDKNNQLVVQTISGSNSQA